VHDVETHHTVYEAFKHAGIHCEAPYVSEVHFAGFDEETRLYYKVMSSPVAHAMLPYNIFHSQHAVSPLLYRKLEAICLALWRSGYFVADIAENAFLCNPKGKDFAILVDFSRVISLPPAAKKSIDAYSTALFQQKGISRPCFTIDPKISKDPDGVDVWYAATVTTGAERDIRNTVAREVTGLGQREAAMDHVFLERVWGASRQYLTPKERKEKGIAQSTQRIRTPSQIRASSKPFGSKPRLRKIQFLSAKDKKVWKPRHRSARSSWSQSMVRFPTRRLFERHDPLRDGPPVSPGSGRARAGDRNRTQHPALPLRSRRAGSELAR